MAAVVIRTGKQAFWQGGIRTAKIVGGIFLASLPFAILEPFLFMIWGSILAGVLLLIVAPYLHMKFWDERASVLYVEAICPYCKKEGRLEPFVKSALAEKFVVLCPECGQTATALVERGTG